MHSPIIQYFSFRNVCASTSFQDKYISDFESSKNSIVGNNELVARFYKLLINDWQFLLIIKFPWDSNTNKLKKNAKMFSNALEIIMPHLSSQNATEAPAPVTCNNFFWFSLFLSSFFSDSLVICSNVAIPSLLSINLQSGNLFFAFYLVFSTVIFSRNLHFLFIVSRQ